MKRQIVKRQRRSQLATLAFRGILFEAVALSAWSCDPEPVDDNTESAQPQSVVQAADDSNAMQVPELLPVNGVGPAPGGRVDEAPGQVAFETPEAGGSDAGTVAFADSGAAPAAARWVGSWATGLQLTEPNNNPPNPGLANNTLRQNMFPTLSGERVRVRFSNEYGTVPVVVDAATIAHNEGGSQVEASSVASLLFDGNPGVTISVGEAVYSDAVEFQVEALQTLSVTTAFGNVAGGITGHPGSRTTSFLATGGAAVDDAAFPSVAQTDHWYIVSNIDVEREDNAGAIVVLGDSITDGRGSTTNENTRWPDFVARNLQRAREENAVSVLNMGIGGNSVLQGGLGPTAIARFDSQVLEQPGVRWVVVLEGVNDLGAIGARSSQQMADALIGAYDEFVDKSHAAGLLIYGATILPFAGSGYGQNANALEARNLINDWIANSGRFDATIDFTPAVSAPGNDQQLREEFVFQNDFLHLNPAGLEAMGDAVDLSLFQISMTSLAEVNR